MEYCCKDKGISVKETFDRVVDCSGTYRFKCGKGFEDFPILYEGFTPDMMMTPEYKFHSEMCSDGVKTTDFIDGKEIITFTKFGAESVYDFDKNVTNLCTKTGPRSYVNISKHKDGRIQ